MSTTQPPSQVQMTAEELAVRVGAVPLWRIRTDPQPGTATEDDVERLRRDEDRLCELIDGVLVEKAVSTKTALLAGELIRILGNFVTARRIGWVFGPDGFVRLLGKHLRAPDVSFIRRDQLPGHRIPDKGYPEVAPALIVEIFSPGNTLREMEQKRRHFFSAGTELCWIVFPDRQEVAVYTDMDSNRVVGCDELLDGGTVLPGFSMKVAELFVNLDLG